MNSTVTVRSANKGDPVQGAIIMGKVTTKPLKTIYYRITPVIIIEPLVLCKNKVGGDAAASLRLQPNEVPKMIEIRLDTGDKCGTDLRRHWDGLVV